MATTPRRLIDSVVRSVCGREVERVVRLTAGGMNETYRVELPNDMAVVHIARQPVPWFIDEEHVMAQARGAGVPTPEVLGVEQVDHDGELLSFSIQRVVPGRSLDELAGELRRGYARVTDLDSAAAGWVPAFAIDWALEKLGWNNPAPPAQQRRCVDVIARYAGA
jgi:hypothetical protein